ncbi:class I SAM-dependent methyltransferase [Micromonospora sp. WMMD1120]|nr:class I SAM-dependent methyltransferase [Micromonospora sp. WMMD1120]MDG4808857.1 class I SAM-dependent methyltransferase [Micromonospora sp. WMMD1120]
MTRTPTECHRCGGSARRGRQSHRLASGRAARRRSLWEAQRAASVAGLLVEAAPRTGGVALDLGCGTGAVARELAARFDRVVGLDRCVCTVRLAAGREGSGSGGVSWLAGDAERIPLLDRSVHLVYSYGVLHHLSLRGTTAEIRRVLAPDGVAVIVDFTMPGSRSAWPHLTAAIRAFPGYRRRLGVRAALDITLFRVDPGWIAHLRRDVFYSPSGFRKQIGQALPGSVVAHEATRSTAVWQAAGTSPTEASNA